jgi:hypothetical protein
MGLLESKSMRGRSSVVVSLNCSETNGDMDRLEHDLVVICITFLRHLDPEWYIRESCIIIL